MLVKVVVVLLVREGVEITVVVVGLERSALHLSLGVFRYGSVPCP